MFSQREVKGMQTEKTSQQLASEKNNNNHKASIDIIIVTMMAKFN